MIRLFLFLSILLTGLSYSMGQSTEFEFGKISYDELRMKNYARDTAARAVVLKERGEAFIQNYGEYNLMFVHHLKIKIFKKSGLSEANFSIPLYKSKGKTEKWISLQASTFNLEGNSWKESTLNPKSYFVDKVDNHYDFIKFTLPDVRVGSVIEIKYSLESPYFYNFHEWNFQGDIPKILSEYKAKIPGNYEYFISLRGYQKLSKNSSSLIKDCFTPGGSNADCVLYEYAMENIPAFVEEEYMTSKNNFLSSIHYELMQVRYFDGRVDKVTKEWKDVVGELKADENFGAQLKKGRSILTDPVLKAIGQEKDPMKRAELVYDFVKNSYRWNENFGKYTEKGIKKAFIDKTGNVSDINLSLAAALQIADLDAYPVIISTRENGLATELHPVMSDFNYVIVQVFVNAQPFLLDATDPLLPFGLLPIHCLNGKGRIIKQESDWVELKYKGKQKTAISLSLGLNDSGMFKGQLSNQYQEYDGYEYRKKVLSHSNQMEYVSELQTKMGGEISHYELVGLNDFENTLIEKYDLLLPGFDKSNADILYFDPFLFHRWETNPFKASERFYPVDLGAPIDHTYTLSLQIPEGFELDDRPENIAIALPRGGGKYLFNISIQGNKLSLTNLIQLNKSLYGPDEYPYLKEFFSRIIQSQQLQLVFKRK